MAEPARKQTDPAAVDPRTLDPINPIPPRETAEERYAAANDRVDNRAIVENQTRGAGSGAIIAIVVLALAALAYFLLAPATTEGPAVAPADPPAATAPATPATPAPDAMAPAAPATPAPDASAPNAAPADPAPATPAPAAPAQ